MITDVAAFMITIGFFASAETGATASAFGVSPKPARMSTLSRVTSSCASAFGDVGRGPGRVLDDELDLLPAEDVAVQLEIGLHAGEDLRAVVGERTGELGDDADLDDLLGDRRAADRKTREPGQCRNEESVHSHHDRLLVDGFDAPDGTRERVARTHSY